MKRASIFVVGVVIVAFLVLTSAFGAMFFKYSKTGSLGYEQFLLMEAYLEGDKSVLYMDTAAEMAYEQASYNFALNAGFRGVSNCNINGINIINGDCDFNDDTVRENFGAYLNHFFNQYAKNYENAYIPFNIYEFYERIGEIVGSAKYPIVVLIGKSNERTDCFPGLLQEFPVAGSYRIEDTWGSQQSPDSIQIKIVNPDTAVIAVLDGEIKDTGKQDGEEFIEIISELNKQNTFHYSHLKVSRAMIKGGSVRAGDIIGSTSDYINFRVYRGDIPMNPMCALQRIKKSSDIKGYYYVKPHISFTPKYSFFEDFNKVMDIAQEMVDDCSGANDYADCVNKYDNKNINNDLVLHVSDCEGNKIMDNTVFGFCVDSIDAEKSFYVYDEKIKSLILEPVKFRFALDLSKGFSALKLSLPKAKKRSPGLAAPKQGILIWPTQGIVTQCFGEPTPGTEPRHGGIDIGAQQGRDVRAAAQGRVIGISVHTRHYEPPCESPEYAGGTHIVLYHADLGLYTKYFHLSEIEDGIEEGVNVEQGQVIGYVGNTGCSTGPHLDFRVSRSQSFTWNTAEDPAQYFPGGCSTSMPVS